MARSGTWWAIALVAFIVVWWVILSHQTVHDVIDVHSHEAFVTTTKRPTTRAPRITEAPSEPNKKERATEAPDEEDNTEGKKSDGDEKKSEDGDQTKKMLVQPLLPDSVLSLLSKASMPDLLGDDRLRKNCDWKEKESKSNVAFAKEFARIFREEFPASKGGALDDSGLHWWLDEGGLIGSSRAGSLSNADDDFDFFALLPNQHAPCRPDSLTCTKEEFDKMIHTFLMTFWNAGMCINKFNPKLSKFESRRRLMYSLQLNRDKDLPPNQCFIQGKPFAHMHLGMFLESGLLKTNIWAAGTTHPMDELDLTDALPVGRCRAGPVDVPCPKNITGFLTVRNRGEYRKKSSDGSCLLVRNKWSMKRKIQAAETVKRLAECGYNSMVDLHDELVASGYKNC